MATTIDQPVVEVYAGPFGWPRIATVGQTITVPSSDSVLEEFTFHYQTDATTGPIVRGAVYAWDGVKATGPLVWESAPRQLSGPTSAVRFQTGGIALTAGERYVLFVSISKDYARNVAEVPVGLNDYSSWGIATAAANGGVDPYPGGDYVYLDNGGDVAALTTHAWTSGAAYRRDMYFSASFSTASSGGCAVGVLAALSLLAALSRETYPRSRTRRSGRDIGAGRDVRARRKLSSAGRGRKRY